MERLNQGFHPARVGWKYNPEQPRLPRGVPGGGRWQAVRALIQVALRLGQEAINAIETYNTASDRNARDRQAVVEFRARSFEIAEPGRIDSALVRVLDRDGVDALCPRHGEAQMIARAAAAEARAAGGDLTPQLFGTAVHARVAREINGAGGSSNPRDPDFRAEASVLKSGAVDYGTAGSIRVDIFENRRDGTVCVYDLKTGRSVLSPLRMKEIFDNVNEYYKGTTRVVVTEIRIDP